VAEVGGAELAGEVGGAPGHLAEVLLQVVSVAGGVGRVGQGAITGVRGFPPCRMDDGLLGARCG
jgi:hypothetical protein